MKEINTYVIETTNAFFTLVIYDKDKKGLYRAAYIGTPRIASPSEMDMTRPIMGDVEGTRQDFSLDILIAACRKEFFSLGGKIILMQDISRHTDR